MTTIRLDNKSIQAIADLILIRLQEKPIPLVENQGKNTVAQITHHDEQLDEFSTLLNADEVEMLENFRCAIRANKKEAFLACVEGIFTALGLNPLYQLSQHVDERQNIEGMEP